MRQVGDVQRVYQCIGCDQERNSMLGEAHLGVVPCSAGLHAVFYLQGYIQHIDRLEEEAREKVRDALPCQMLAILS